MKLKLKGIRFSTWLYFLAFSLVILSLLGFLLVVLIKPYYRQDRIKTIGNISSSIEELLISKEVSEADLEKTTKMVVGNNVCMIIYNENGKELYYYDSLGQMCLLDQNIAINGEDLVIRENPLTFIEMIKNSNPFTVSIDSNISNTQMLLYGEQFKTNLANYYLVINTPLEPVESYINFILRQYGYISVFVILISLVIAFYLAKRISSPIVKMKNEANKLASGDYNVNFKSNSFEEINELASTLDDATKKLSKINELRKDLVANVSHDIKTPLTMIQAYAEMIKDISGDDKDKRNEHLDVILKEVEYLNKLVSDMSELSKLQSGVIEIKRNNFDLSQTVLGTISLLKQLINDKQLQVITNMESCILYADEIKISQVIYNFLSNAIKHSNNGSRIEINILEDEEKVRLEVKDYGEGISSEILPYIWDRYYKVDKNYSRSVNSTGLGLAIVKAIIEAHKGKYGVVSKVSEGSTFYFELSKDYEED